MKAQNIEQLAINTIRTLAMDAVQQANSGHPGTPMALAPVAYSLWQNLLANYDPANPSGPTATASCCRAAMPRCCCTRMLHLAGVKCGQRQVRTITGEPSVPLDDIKKFRQLRQPVPGPSGVSLDRPASKRPPARWARAWPRASAWPSRANGWRPTSTGPASSCSTTTSTSCAATAT